MENPFPGMDPYLEAPDVWRGLQFQFAVYLSDALNAAMPDDYYTSFGKRAFEFDASIKDFSPWWVVRRLGPEAAAKLSYDAPVEIETFDEGLAESYVKIYQLPRPAKLVGIIDILSPIDKLRGTPGRRIYLKQQRRRLERDAHLIEIDLLRDGIHTAACPMRPRPDEGCDYLVCLHRAGTKNKYEVWPWALRDRLPRIAVPLIDGAADVVLDLQPVLNRCHQAGRYELLADYDKECSPAVSQEDAKWIDEVLREEGLRR